MTTDYRALCLELLQFGDQAGEIAANEGLWPDCDPGPDWLLDRARAALAQPEPAELTDEELARRFRVWWHDEGSGLPPLPGMDHKEHVRRISEIAWANGAYAARWGTPAIKPVPVSERLPEPSVRVLAHYLNALGKGRTICAIWVPAKSRSDEGDLDADDFLEYDEESDKYHWPEGWYEAIENWEELGWAKVYEGEIAYWQPLPQWPATALATPEAPNV